MVIGGLALSKQHSRSLKNVVDERWCSKLQASSMAIHGRPPNHRFFVSKLETDWRLEPRHGEDTTNTVDMLRSLESCVRSSLLKNQQTTREYRSEDTRYL